jgi:hypothetical protein
MNREANCACSKETRVGSELGLNREIALNNSTEASGHRRKGGEKEMNFKRLTKAVSVATLLTVISFSIGLAQAGHFYVHFESGAINWYIGATNDTYYYDDTGYINKASSTQDTNAWIWWPGSVTVNYNDITETDVNTHAYIEATYDGGSWHANADAWTYPSYWENPYGGYSNTW